MDTFVTNQGSVSKKGTILYEARSVPVLITRIMLSNTEDSDFTITLKKYKKASGEGLIQIFRYEMLAGYVYEDDGEYLLEPGDYIISYTDSDTVVFILEGYDKNI